MQVAHLHLKEKDLLIIAPWHAKTMILILFLKLILNCVNKELSEMLHFHVGFAQVQCRLRCTDKFEKSLCKSGHKCSKLWRHSLWQNSLNETLEAQWEKISRFFVTDCSFMLKMCAINAKLSCAHKTRWFSSPFSWTNYLSPRQQIFKQIASVTMVITGNSRLLMPNVPITMWFVAPLVSYSVYFLSLAVWSF